jgi:hypothetical protein
LGHWLPMWQLIGIQLPTPKTHRSSFYPFLWVGLFTGGILMGLLSICMREKVSFNEFYSILRGRPHENVIKGNDCEMREIKKPHSYTESDVTLLTFDF